MYENIYKDKDKYSIDKSMFGERIHYGKYDTLEDAVKQRKLLVKYNWIKNKSTGYPPEEHFERYDVEQNTQNKYIVKNRKNGKCYGSYKSKKYAKIVKKILPYFTGEINIELIEKKATEEFYKHITYNKLKGLYQISYHNLIRASDKSLANILTERDLLIKYEGDEELMCENINNIYQYSEEELPPFLKNCENITYDMKSKYKYKVRKQIRNHNMIIGQYSNYELAHLIKSYLDDKKWRGNEIKHIQEVTKTIHERNKYIQKKYGRYHIIRNKKNKIISYGSYENIHYARFIRDKLNENNWNDKIINDLEKDYEKKNRITQYFYDNTDYLSKT